MHRKRLFSWLALLIGFSIVLSIGAYFSWHPHVVEWQSTDTESYFKSDRWFILPYECATLTWQADAANRVELDGVGVSTSDSQRICPKSSHKYTLTVTDQTGTPRNYTFYVRVLFSTSNMRLFGLTFVLGLLLIVFLTALLGDLPWLSPRLQPLLKSVILLSRAGSLFLRQIISTSNPAAKHEFVYCSVLAVFVAIPLIVLRFVDWPQTDLIVFVSVVGGGGIVFQWWRFARSATRDHRPTEVSSAKNQPRTLRVSMGILVLLLICTIMGFYVPMQHQIWLGGDEIRVMEDASRGWTSISVYDRLYGRPLTPLAAILAGKLVPNAIDGFVWLAFAFKFLGVVLLYGIVRMVVPKREHVALAAAILFAVSPTEYTRFLAVYMHAYYATVFLLLLSLYLFLRSGRSGSTLLLLLSCISLGTALLIVEVGFTIALFWPILLFFTIGYQKRFLVWIYTWGLTIILLAVRFVVYVAVADDSYQSSSSMGGAFDPARWITNFFTQLKPMFRYFRPYEATWTDWLYAAIPAALTAAGILWLTKNHPQTTAPNHKLYRVGILLSGIGLVLGFLPYITISGFLGTFRTQFVSAPFQAVWWTLVIVYLTRWLFTRWSRYWAAGVIGVMVLFSTVASLKWQENRWVNPQVEYDKTAYITQQILEIAPRVEPDTVLIFITDENVDTPLGWSYYIYMWSKYILGVEGYQIGYTDTFGIQHEFDAQGKSDKYGYRAYSFDEMVAFKIEVDGTVTLLEELPDRLLVEKPNDADQYNPRARIQDGPIQWPRFLISRSSAR